MTSFHSLGFYPLGSFSVLLANLEYSPCVCPVCVPLGNRSVNFALVYLQGCNLGVSIRFLAAGFGFIPAHSLCEKL